MNGFIFSKHYQLAFSVNFIQSISESLHALIDVKNEQSRESLNALQEKIHLLNIKEELINSNDQLLKEVHKIIQKEIWTDGDLEEIDTYWSQFWYHYSSRAEELLDIHFELKNDESNSNRLLNLLLAESDQSFQLFYPLGVHDPLSVSYSIHILMDINYDFSRRRPQDLPLPKEHKVYRLSNGVVIFIQRLFLWFLIPIIVIALLLENDLTLGNLIPLITFDILSFYARNVNKHYLYKKSP